MKLNLSLLVPLVSTISAESFCPSKPAETAQQTDIFYQFVRKFYINKDVKTAFADHFDHAYIEHNPNASSGWTDSSLDGLAGFIASANLTILHAGFYNNTGYVHFREEVSGSPPTAVVDILKFDGTCIVEHWDVAQARPENPSNPRAMW
ncbi:hypothetical protein ONS95_014302 [Cadophora gregata]|uniref:uncharacterized protein n=1 Tax=Cadophora gregata TaxID=51156 RepID=UPI0026DCEB48|nr:uncharacterized protein ONS95_014302 [Cadophora gregata]KAK0114822.1 hypothetical protein ONS95_014302 [Cadophora gregata]